MAGRRTSVYLSEDLAAAVDAADVPLAELIRDGLATRTPPSGPGGIRIVADARMPPGLAALVGPGHDGKPQKPAVMKIGAKDDCPHRLPPGAFCKRC